jgi:hypothetical protein
MLAVSSAENNRQARLAIADPTASRLGERFSI